jgi:carbamoyl-phosphate synthase large subunit
VSISARPLTIAVTGLNATDNPGPGVPVLRSLRDGARPGERRIGLTYDALDPGVYARDLADRVFLLTYPSAGARAFLDRLAAIHERAPLDVIIPTLDAELPLFIALAPQLRAMGIALFVPTEEQLELRGKAQLAALGRVAGIDVPETAVVASVEDIARVDGKVQYPLYVKGPYYGATLATCREEAIAAYHRALAAWGGPVILQASVRGEEVNLVGVGDGKGGLLGPVVMKKLALTDKGKGWAGVTIRHEALVDVATRFAAATKWRGPLEVEALRAGPKYHVIEINPRFPAWVHLATGAGVDLPRVVVDLARGETPPALPPYEVGKLFVRISLDQVIDMRDFERIVTTGEIAHAATISASLRVRPATTR